MTALRILHLGAADTGGGAAGTSLRLSRALRSAGADSLFLVGRRASDDESVLQHGAIDACFPGLRPRLESLPCRAYRRRTGATYHAGVLPDRVAAAARALGPSIVNLHWVAGGFMQIETLPRLPAPIVWTLHDSWPFTGGCHVPADCDRFIDRCGACPVLGSRCASDLSRLVWGRKRRAWRGLPITIVSPSASMAERARRSSLFRESRVEVIPNGIDTSRYRPLDRSEARSRLGLAEDAPTVLFAAMWAEREPNKGFQFLAPALAEIRLTGGRRPHLLVAGSTTLHRHPALADVPARSLGVLRDDEAMSWAIAAADVVAVPSMQENCPNSVLEALACGRPAVGFRVSGLRDLVTEGVDGLLVPPFDVRALASALQPLLEDPRRAAEMGRAGREKVEDRLGLTAWARRYLELYDDLQRSTR